MERGKKKFSYADRGVTTFGDKIKDHITAINEEYEEYVKDQEFIRERLIGSGRKDEWRIPKFMYLYMNAYCKEGNDCMLPAEFSVTVFSVQGGIHETISGFFDPGKIPCGEKSVVLTTCQENALPVPGKFMAPAKVFKAAKFLSKLHGLAKEYDIYGDKKGVLVLTTRENMPVIKNCLKWIARKTNYRKLAKYTGTGSRGVSLCFLRFETVLMEMSQFAKLTKQEVLTNKRLEGYVAVDDGGPIVQEKKKLAREAAKFRPGTIIREGGAARFLSRTHHDFVKEIGCEWHKTEHLNPEGWGPHCDKIDKCARSITLRRVGNALNYLKCLFTDWEKPLPSAKLNSGVVDSMIPKISKLRYESESEHEISDIEDERAKPKLPCFVKMKR